MTKTIISAAAILFTASVTAGPLYEDNVDTYGTALSSVDSNMAIATEPGIGDSYGSSFYFPSATDAAMGGDTHSGSDDTAGNVLYDVTDIRW